MEDSVEPVDGSEEHDAAPWWSTADRQARVLVENRRIRDNDIKPLKILRKMLVGPDFGGGVGDANFEKPTNTVYGFYSRVLSHVLGGNLQCVIGADEGSPEEPIALGYERAVNKTFDRVGGPRIAEMVLADMVCGYGAMLVTPPEESTTTLRENERELLRNPLGRGSWTGDDALEPRLKANEAGELLTEAKPIIDANPRQPGLMYLAPQFWSYDRRAFTVDEMEFFEYVTSHDINVLIDQAKASDGVGKWKVAELRHARTAIYTEDEAKVGGDQTRMDGFATNTERDRIMLTNLVVMNAKIEGREPPKNHNAVVYTIWSPTTDIASGVWVREPYYTFVPPWGPLVMFTQHITGEDSLPFSVLTANKTKVCASDAIHGVAYKRIREYRSNPVFDARKAADVAALEDAADGIPVAISGENGLQYQNVVRGGLDAVIVNAIQYLDERLSEDLGFSSAERGAAVGGDVTATETTVAAQQTNAKVLQFQKAFNEGIANVFRTMAWYIGHDAQFMVRADFRSRAAFHEEEAVPFVGAVDAAEVGRRVAKTRGSQGLIQGGDFSETEDFDFSELRFDVNAQLQRAITPEQRRMESRELRAELIQLMEVAVMMPHYEWISEVRRLEEDYGRRGLVDNFRAEIASLRAQAMIESGQTEAQVGSAPGPGSQSGPTFGVAPGRSQPQPQAMPAQAGPEASMTPMQ